MRAYAKNGGRLIKWTAFCFAGLALNNVLLALDHVVFEQSTLPWRAIPAAIGLCALAYGLLREELAR